MKATVIVCSYNRCQSLATTLESIAASTFSVPMEWEVLVIDNNSSDQTREVAEDFCRRFPDHFRYLFEPQQGKSNALNTGIREARGEILAFTDDDVTVEPTWLENLTASLHDDAWAGAGGRIYPARDVSPPHWLALKGPYSMAGLLALLDRGEDACQLIEAPYGANMAFRKSMFEKYGGFRTDLGPPPKLRGEDTEFCQRLMKAGERLRYEPSAIAYHAVPENRLKKKYFLTWWFDYGRCTVLLREKRPPIWGIPSDYISVGNRVVRLMPAGIRRWIRASDPQWRFSCTCWLWMTVGETVEFVRQSFTAKKSPSGSSVAPSGSGNGNV
jgi:glucosyl-dolichyl phosphate glucuronosyltransferase